MSPANDPQAIHYGFHIASNAWNVAITGPRDALDAVAQDLLPKRRRLGRPPVLQQVHRPQSSDRSTWFANTQAIGRLKGEARNAGLQSIIEFASHVSLAACDKHDDRFTRDPRLEFRAFTTNVMSATVLRSELDNGTLKAQVAKPVMSLGTDLGQSGIEIETPRAGLVINFDDRHRLSPNTDRKLVYNPHSPDIEYDAEDLTPERLIIALGALTQSVRVRPESLQPAPELQSGA